MTSPLYVPASVQTNGTIKAVFAPAFVAYLTAPKLTEANAAGALEFSCYATGEGVNMETTENSVEDPRLCSKAVYEAPGDNTSSLEIEYVFNPKSAADNEAQLELVEGRKGFVLLRWAVDTNVPLAIGDIVDIVPGTLGVQRKNRPTRNGVHKITQKVFVTGPVARDVVMVA